MRHAIALLLLAAAGCGGGSPAPSTTTAATPTPAGAQPERSGSAGGGLPAAADPDPSQLCDVFSTIRLEVVYEGCAEPTTIALDYNPTAEQQLDISESSSDVGVASLVDVDFVPEGCVFDGTWVRGDEAVSLSVYATGDHTMGGIAVIGASCDGRVTGSWTEWTD